MTHEVLVGVPHDVVVVGAVLREVELGLFEDGDEIGQLLDHLLAVAELGGVVEVGVVGKLVRLEEGLDDLLVDLVADVGLAFEGDEILETGAGRDLNGGVGWPAYLSLTYLIKSSTRT